MRRAVVLVPMLFTVLACRNSSDETGGVDLGSGKRRHVIASLADCQTIRDYPYARNLFCPAAFTAAQTMVEALAASVGVAKPLGGSFYFYQTVADPDAAPGDQAQTTAACLDSAAPWGSTQVVGAGAPLCHLIAYVSSPGPAPGGGESRNPVPAVLRALPQYFRSLYPPESSSLLNEFRAGASFDAVVAELGAAARDRFLEDDPSFSSGTLYDPDQWTRDAQYHGISGGGGGGWGGEIGIERRNAVPLVLLAFGGGGGGGMTSMRAFGVTTSRIGAGGGGGMQLADGYRFEERPYGGLGLGAGVGSDDAQTEYSYFDYDGSGRPQQPVHAYNPAVIADHQAQVVNLVAQLQAVLAAGGTVVLRGGGGMGAGAEYLRENGEEFEPHALSTQAGFQFRYEFRRQGAPHVGDLGLDSEQQDAYALLGEFYREANIEAYRRCGRDYANITCICPTAHGLVIEMVMRELGDPAKIPAWLHQQHCPPDVPNAPDLAGS